MGQRRGSPVATSFCSRVMLIFFWWPSLTGAYILHEPRSYYRSEQRLWYSREESTDQAAQEPVSIPILYESDRVLIINKPEGIAHHNDNDQDGIVNRIRQQQNQRLWGVHRLDKVTSGILVLAKDANMASALTMSFAEGNIQKVYVGVSAKPPKKKKQGWVQGGMQKSRDKSWKLTRNSKKNFAKTRFFTTRIHLPDDDHDEQSLKQTCILFRPFTGKTHQLRVAAKSMGIPLLGDPIYKDGDTSESHNPPRTYLHATGIHIPALDGDEAISIWCPPPFLDPKTPELGKLMKKHCDVPSILQAMEEALELG